MDCEAAPATDAATRAEIEALVVEHAWAVDHRDPQRFLELFTEDARLEGLGPEPVVGKSAIRDWITQLAASQAVTTRHFVMNPRLERRDEDVVLGWVTQLFFVGADGHGTMRPEYVGEYCDIYRRENGVWRFAQRHLVRTFTNVPDG